MDKPSWLQDSIAKEDGFYSVRGEKLKGRRLTLEQIRIWNKTAPTDGVMETVPVEEVVSITIEDVVPTIVEDSIVIEIESEEEEEEVEYNGKEESFVVTETKTLSKMTKKELLILAANNNIEVDHTDKKELILQILEKGFS